MRRTRISEQHETVIPYYCAWNFTYFSCGYIDFPKDLMLEVIMPQEFQVFNFNQIERSLFLQLKKKIVRNTYLKPEAFLKTSGTPWTTRSSLLTVFLMVKKKINYVFKLHFIVLKLNYFPANIFCMISTKSSS